MQGGGAERRGEYRPARFVAAAPIAPGQMLRVQSQIETAMFQGLPCSVSSLATAPEKLLGIVKHHSLRRQGQLEEVNLGIRIVWHVQLMPLTGHCCCLSLVFIITWC